MTFEIGFVLGLTVLALILFAWEGIGVDVAAGVVMALLLLSGLITPAQGLAGFSNSATVTVTAMFVLSAGLTRTGALTAVGDWLADVGRESPSRALAALMGTVAVISGFINNTAAVAIFLPIVLDMSRRIEVSPSKLLMPLSFAAIFGGTCTLVQLYWPHNGICDRGLLG